MQTRTFTPPGDTSPLTLPALMRWALTGALLISAIASPVRALNVDEVENPRHSHGGWVTDELGLLGNAARQIEERLETLHQQLGAEVAWVILQTIGDRDPRHFGTELLHHWGVGRKEHDDGVLVLHVLDRRRIEVVTGYGVEAALPDIKCAWLLREVAVPAFRANEFARGHLALSRGIDRALRSPDITHADLIHATHHDDTQLATTPAPAAKLRVASSKTTSSDAWLWPMLCALAIPLVSWRARVYRQLSPLNRGSDLVAPYGFLFLFFLFAISFSSHSATVAGSMFAGGFALVLIRGFSDVRTLRKRMAPLRCRSCPGQLRWVNEEDAVALLSPGARKERELGSMRFEVKRCGCGEQCIEGFKLVSKIRLCPGCGFRTLVQVQTLTLTAATTSAQGKNESVHRCAFCSREVSEIVTIPHRERSTRSTVESSSSTNSSSSSNQSFGGGDSGGGGAGASY